MTFKKFIKNPYTISIISGVIILLIGYICLPQSVSVNSNNQSGGITAANVSVTVTEETKPKFDYSPNYLNKKIISNYESEFVLNISADDKINSPEKMIEVNSSQKNFCEKPSIISTAYNTLTVGGDYGGKHLSSFTVKCTSPYRISDNGFLFGLREI